MARFRTFESLGVRDYRLLWMGQCSTSMGQWMDQVTRGWLIYSLTGSKLDLGLATAVRGLPLLLFSLVAGAFADRSGRKAQLIVAQFTNAFLNLILATLVITHQVHPWHVYLTGFLAGTVQAFQQPARQTLISDIVGNDRLQNALALNSAALNGSRALGPAIAGAFITAVGTEGSYYLQAGMYFFATIWTMQMRVPDRAPDHGLRAQEPFFQAIGGGLSYVAKERDIRTLLLLALGPLTFGMSYTSLMPVIAKDVLHGGAALQGLILSSIGIGSLLGALVVASLRRSYGYGLPVVLGGVAFSICVFGLGSSHHEGLTLFIGFFLGLFNVTYTTQNQTLLQVITPRHLRGRVMSIWLLNRGFVPVGALAAGALAARFGGPETLKIMSGVSLAIIALVLISTPSFLRMKIPFNDAARDRLDAELAGNPEIPPGGPRDGVVSEPSRPA